MKFTVSRDTLLNSIMVAQEVITNKSPLSILSNVLLTTAENKVILKCTNSTVHAITSFAAEIEEPGETTVFCDKFMSIISSLPMGDVEISNLNNEILVKSVSKKVKFKIKTLAADKFPIIKNFDSQNAIKISAKTFKTMIRNTSFAVSNDPNRYFMTGCFLCNHENNLTMVATDSRRMSVCNSIDFKHNVIDSIIPKKMLTVIDKYCQDEGEIEINTTAKQFMVKSGSLEVTSSLIEGKYPAWQKVLPIGLDKTISVSKIDLENAIKTAGIMATKEKRVNLQIDKGKMIVKTPETEIGNATEEIAAEYDGIPVNIALNIQYLSDVLKVLDAENVSIDFKTNQESKVTSALIVRDSKNSDNNSSIHIIMPMTN